MNEKPIENRGEIIIYRAEDNTVQLDVRVENETVWLTASQMAMLFDRDVKTIRKHINNALREELDKSLVVANFASTKKYGRREGFTQQKEEIIYNLDVIISVGYRVKSQRGVQFRQWANRILKDYLVKGFAVNEKLRREQLSDLRQLVQIVGRTVQSKAVESADETQAIFDVVLDYTYAFSDQEPLLFGRQQTYCGYVVPVVSTQQRHSLSRGWHQASGGQHPCRLDPHDCREPHRRKRHHGQSSGEFNKPEELKL